MALYSDYYAGQSPGAPAYNFGEMYYPGPDFQGTYPHSRVAKKKPKYPRNRRHRRFSGPSPQLGGPPFGGHPDIPYGYYGGTEAQYQHTPWRPSWAANPNFGQHQYPTVSPSVSETFGSNYKILPTPAPHYRDRVLY